MRYEVFCTVTMKREFVEANSEYEAKKKLAQKYGYPISCFDICK